METRIVPTSIVKSPDLEARLAHRIGVRTMAADEFIDRYASGTLRKNKRLGMAWYDQYLTERTAYEFGWEFALTPRSRILVGDAYTEGDCHAITEAGWHIERYQTLSLFPEDRFTAKYLNVEERDGTRKEGIGIVVEQTSAPFIPKSHVAYALVAPYDPVRKAWLNAKNPA